MDSGLGRLNIVIILLPPLTVVPRYPELDDVLLPFVGSREFINDTEYTRYCLWLVGKRPADYAHIPELTERFRYVSDYRKNSPVDRIQKTANKPYLFTQNRQPETDYLLIPRVSSENRRYIPVGFLPPNVIASDSAVLVYNASLVDFGIICSNVHTVCPLGRRHGILLHRRHPRHQAALPF